MNKKFNMAISQTPPVSALALSAEAPVHHQDTITPQIGEIFMNPESSPLADTPEESHELTTQNMATMGKRSENATTLETEVTDDERQAFHSKSFEEIKAIVAKNEAVYGKVACCKKKENIIKHINPLTAAHIIADIIGCVYDTDTMKLWLKDASSGVWSELPDEVLANQVNTLFLFYFKLVGLEFGFKANANTAVEIVKAIKGCCAVNGFFAADQKHYVHCQNCFVCYDAETHEWKEYELTDDRFRSRNQINAYYDPSATAPRFNALLEGVATVDGIRVLQGYMGQILLGRNLTQTILLVTGEAGSGKSTVVIIIQNVLGEKNATELRTNAIRGYYEVGRYEGHSLLIGQDVSSTFLRERGIEKIKALTGGDRVTVEKKRSNWVGSFHGHLNVIVVSNCRQPIRIDGDRDAWGRRVRSVHFHQPDAKPEPIRDYGSILAREEGSGILNFALKGLAQIIEDGCQLKPSEEQKKQIEDLLDESESVRIWLEHCVSAVPYNAPQTPCSKENSVTTMEAYTSYRDYCHSRNWTPLAMSLFSRQLPDHMAASFSVEPSNSVTRDEGNKRGYKGVVLINLPSSQCDDEADVPSHSVA